MEILIDYEKHLIRKNEKTVELPRKEFELLYLLCSMPGKVFSRKQLYDGIWGSHSSSKIRTVDVHIVNIRKKIGTKIIKTIKGVGYKIPAGVNVIRIGDNKMI